MELFNTNIYEILTPLDGQVIPVSKTPDDVFAEKILGDGIAVVPTSGEVCAPVSGTIVSITETLHAICIRSDAGVEILVHLGVDTVSLEGAGFTCHVTVGQQVAAGEKLMDMDLNFIRSKNLSTVSPCIITNLDQVKDLEIQYGNATAGKTVVMTYKI